MNWAQATIDYIVGSWIIWTISGMLVIGMLYIIFIGRMVDHCYYKAIEALTWRLITGRITKREYERMNKEMLDK